jgi:hypothetical protein
VLAGFGVVGIFVALCTLSSLNRSVAAASRQASAAKAANTLAKQNAKIQMRAYVSPSGRDGKAPVQFDPYKVSLTISFYNGGQTPALHFNTFSFNNNPNHEVPRFRTQYRSTYVGEGTMKGMVMIRSSAMGMTDASIAAGGFETESLEVEAKQVAQFVAAHKGKHDNALYVLSGLFEYCDVFGRYWCDSYAFQLEVDPTPHFVSSMMEHVPCKAPPEGVSPPGFPKGYKNETFVPLPRCEQPSEMEQDEGGMTR